MKFQNLSVKRLFGRVAIGFALSMSGITIALFLVTKQTAVLLTGALVGIFVLTQAFGKRLSQFTADLCQTLDHMIAGNEAPQRPEDSETQLARIGHRLARLYQIMQENRRRVDEERQELQTLVSDISHQVKTPVSNLKMATDTYLVLTPMSDGFELHANNAPGCETQEVRLSLFTKGSYTKLKNALVRTLLGADFYITDRRYIGFETDTGYHHYAIDVAQIYELEV